eukprot:TRINITY_DN25418_c0_g1_i1.p1 TRINITY_DN25418_c0_g1~~TRINITY_DN25418_c0_g1_i1.p1  ORF type:complete len:369 (+),score=100.44 TRINITY_DN25418_c0_g1_i1:87-1193(+)
MAVGSDAANSAATESPAKKPKKDIGMTWQPSNAGEGKLYDGFPKPGESVLAPLTYQGDDVPRGLVATGKVRTMRDGSGSDGEYIGCDFVRRDVPVTNGRGKEFNLDDNAFAFVADPIEHIDYNSEDDILRKYYPKCCELVKRMTGASRVVAFDHNMRSKAMSEAKKKIEGGNAVQGPAFVVHNDYTVTSAPRRLRILGEPTKVNDTMRPILGEKSLFDPQELDQLMKGRWAMINVWRNIKATPVQSMPLGLCDGGAVPLEDVIVFEIHYADRIGENYFAAHSAGHKWYYFPEATRDEAILIKQWDSAGAQFAAKEDSIPKDKRVPSTFSFHSAFEDPSSPPDADDRASIEVRTIVFYEEEAQAAKGKL